ncbi:hypothetical protein T10_4387, partial [Trichinella papuae]
LLIVKLFLSFEKKSMTVQMPCSNDATKSANKRKASRRCSSQSSAVRAKRAMFRKIRRQLLRRLHKALPKETRATTSPRDEVSVLNEAVNLIDQLHQAIFARVQSGQLPPELISYLGLVSTQASDPGKVANQENCCTPGELYKKLQSRIPANFTSTKESSALREAWLAVMRLPVPWSHKITSDELMLLI